MEICAKLVSFQLYISLTSLQFIKIHLISTENNLSKSRILINIIHRSLASLFLSEHRQVEEVVEGFH